jgi:hypothetical protein
MHFPNGKVLLPEHGNRVARRHEYRQTIGEIDGIDLIERTLGEVYGLPGEQKDVYCVVPLVVALAMPWRKDLLTPGRREPPDKNGRQLCKSLCHLKDELFPLVFKEDEPHRLRRA